MRVQPGEAAAGCSIGQYCLPCGAGEQEAAGQVEVGRTSPCRPVGRRVALDQSCGSSCIARDGGCGSAGTTRWGGGG